MTFPTVRARVAFGSAPLADPPTWTDVSAYARRFTAKAGRDFELDPFQPGTAELVLDNTDRRFDPLHASGPYFGDLLPRKRINVQADWGAHLVLTGASGSRATSPDAAAVDITGDIDIRAKLALTDWTPAAAGVIASKATFTGNQVAYGLGINTDGTLTLFWSPTGTGAATVSVSSTVAPTVADGDTLWVRATLDVDDGSGNRVIRFYTSTDATHDHSQVTWTQLGAATTTAGTTSIFASTSPLALGAHPENINRLTGNLYAAAVLNGIGGTVVANPDFTDGNRFTAGATSGTDATGRIWTVNSPASLVAETYDLFTGYVDAWPQTYSRLYGESPVTATDGFKILAQAQVASAWEEEVYADDPTGWWRLADDTPTSDNVADSSGNNHDGTFKGLPVSTDGLLVGQDNAAVLFDGINDRAVLDPLVVFTTGPLSVEAWVKTSTLPPTDSIIWGQFHPNGSNLALYVNKAAGELWFFYVDSGGASRLAVGPVVTDGATHHLVGTLDTDKVARLYVDGALVASSLAGSSLSLYSTDSVAMIGYTALGDPASSKFAGVLDEIAIYDSALSADRVLAHYQAGNNPYNGDTTGARIARVLDLVDWPDADRDLDTGRSVMGAWEGSDTNALDLMQTAEVTEGGALWIDPAGAVTFRDRYAPTQDANATTTQSAFTDDETATDGASYTDLVLTYDDNLIFNDVSVTWVDGVQRRRSTASIATYTRQDRDVQTGLTTSGEARARAEWLLDRFGNPEVRPSSVTLRPSGDPSLWRHALARRIGDRVTVRRRPQSTGTPIEFDATIETIEHTVDDGINTWETTFGLSVTVIDQGYLVLDDPTRGLLNTGRLAY